MSFDFERVAVEGVTKVFGPTRALSDVSFGLSAKTVTVLRGPNGSGKSTLLRILSTLVRPTAGHVRYGDSAPSDPSALRARIGLLSHAALIYPDLTPVENLTLRAKLYRLPNARTVATGAVGRFDIASFCDRPCRTLSRGQLQRVALAAAVLHAPRLLLLDEPTTGLDKASTERLCATLAEEKARGAILLLSTHDPAIADRIGDREVSLERGRLAAPAPT